MRLVRNWREAWKWHSAQILALIAVLPAIWAELPLEIKALIPEAWLPWVLAGVALAGVIGRLRDQSKGAGE